MTEQTQEQLLEGASRSLTEFQHGAGCSWCKMKAMQIQTAVDELKDAMPIAEELSEKIENLRSENIIGVLDEIKELKIRAGVEDHPHGNAPKLDAVDLPPPIREDTPIPPSTPLNPDAVNSGGLLSRESSARLFRGNGGGLAGGSGGLASGFMDRIRGVGKKKGPIRRRLSKS